MGGRAFIGLPIGVAVVVVLVAVTPCLPEPGGGVEWVQRADAVVVQMKTIDTDGTSIYSEMPRHLYEPDFTLYGDGSLILKEPEDPSTYRLRKATLSQGDVRELLEFIDSRGFFDFGYQQPQIQDLSAANNTLFYAAKRDAANAVRALAIDKEVPDSGAPWEQFHKLHEIKARLDKVTSGALADPSTVDYAPAAVILLVQNAFGRIPSSRQWQLSDIDLQTIALSSGGVGERRLEGEQAALAVQNIPSDGETVTQGNQIFQVAYRPVLPYEENFPEFEPPTQ